MVVILTSKPFISQQYLVEKKNNTTKSFDLTRGKPKIDQSPTDLHR